MDVIVVAMCHGKNIDGFVAGPSDVRFEICPERHPLVVAIFGIVNVGVVEREQLAGIGLDQAAVGVPQRVKRNFGHNISSVSQCHDLGVDRVVRSKTKGFSLL
jgi:hypothetical protein